MNDELQAASINLQRSMRRLRAMQWEREAEQRRARRPEGKYVPAHSRNRGIAEDAVLRQPVPGDEHAEFWVVPSPMRKEWQRMQERPNLPEFLRKLYNPDALNGYVAFDKRHAPRVGDGTGNIVQYVPVHGGVTYATKDSYAAVWGFDTCHAGSEKEPVGDQAWIIANCWILYRGLKLGEQLWPEFRRANRDRRAELAQQLLDLVEEQPLNEKLGFEAMVNMLFGKIG